MTSLDTEICGALDALSNVLELYTLDEIETAIADWADMMAGHNHPISYEFGQTVIHAVKAALNEKRGA